MTAQSALNSTFSRLFPDDTAHRLLIYDFSSAIEIDNSVRTCTSPKSYLTENVLLLALCCYATKYSRAYPDSKKVKIVYLLTICQTFSESVPARVPWPGFFTGNSSQSYLNLKKIPKCTSYNAAQYDDDYVLIKYRLGSYIIIM